MLTAQDMSYDEARNLHSKWQKHQAFMAELASNKDWLDKIREVQNCRPIRALSVRHDPTAVQIHSAVNLQPAVLLTSIHSLVQALKLHTHST